MESAKSTIDAGPRSTTHGLGRPYDEHASWNASWNACLSNLPSSATCSIKASDAMNRPLESLEKKRLNKCVPFAEDQPGVPWSFGMSCASSKSLPPVEHKYSVRIA